MSGTDSILTSALGSNQSGTRYFPTVGGIVVGVIVQKTADNYRVDIGSPSLAVLSNIAFNSASKRHRPNLKVGQAVICHVTSANKYLDTELSCEDPTSQKDWVTTEVYFGGLPEGGLLIEIPVTLSERLAAKDCPVFGIIGQYLKPFEVAVGVNGKAYIKCADGDHLRAVLVAEAIRKCENMPLLGIEDLCQDLEKRLRH